jgi:hypothetical protein
LLGISCIPCFLRNPRFLQSAAFLRDALAFSLRDIALTGADFALVAVFTGADFALLALFTDLTGFLIDTGIL